MNLDRKWQYMYRHARKKAMRKARHKRVFTRWKKRMYKRMELTKKNES